MSRHRKNNVTLKYPPSQTVPRGVCTGTRKKEHACTGHSPSSSAAPRLSSRIKSTARKLSAVHSTARSASIKHPAPVDEDASSTGRRIALVPTTPLTETSHKLACSSVPNGEVGAHFTGTYETFPVDAENTTLQIDRPRPHCSLKTLMEQDDWWLLGWASPFDSLRPI